jgi:hypothetical protein
MDFLNTIWLCPGGPTPCNTTPSSLTFAALPAGVVVTGQVAAFGVGPLGVSLSQPFMLISEP